MLMADHFLMSTNIDEAAFSLRGSIDKILKPDDTCSNNNEQPCGVREENHLVIDPTTFVSTVANSSIDPSDGAPVGDKAEDTVAKPTEIVVLDSASTEVTENDDTAVSPPAEDPQISFPQRLMEILDDEHNEETIAWLPHGRAFTIYRKQDFENVILPQYFQKQSKYSSFTRKLNRWGFVRVTRGPETGAYYHGSFQRGGHSLCNQMTCHNIAISSGIHRHNKKGADAAYDPSSKSSPEDAPMRAEPYHHGHEQYPPFQHPHMMIQPYPTFQPHMTYPPNTYYPPPPDHDCYYPNPHQTSDHHPLPEDHGTDHHAGPYHSYDVYHHDAYYASYPEPSHEVRGYLSEEEQNAHLLTTNQTAMEAPVPRPDGAFPHPQSLISMSMVPHLRQLGIYEPRRDSDREHIHDHFHDAAEGYHRDGGEEKHLVSDSTFRNDQAPLPTP